MSATIYGTGYSGSEHQVVARGRYQPAPLTRRAVLVHQGHGQTALSSLPPAMLTAALGEIGVPVLSADFVDGSQWGNDTVQTRITSLWTYAQTNYGAKTDKVCLVGVSMGGACVLNWAISNPTKVAAIVLTIPAVDIGDIYDNNRSSVLGITQPGDIDAAYGGAGSYSGATRSTHNPAVNAAALAGIPILLFYSGNDPVCIPATQTAFKTAVGSSCTIVNMGNYGHGSPTLPDVETYQVAWQATTFLAQYV